MTEEEYIEYCAERAREEARRNLHDERFIQPFSRVLEDTVAGDFTQSEWENALREMGYEGVVPKLE